MYELPIPDEYVDNVPDDDDLPALSYGVHRLRRIQIPGDIPGLPPARSSDRGERARSGGHRTRVDPYGPQRHEGTSGSRPRPDEPPGLALRGRRSLDGVASRNGTRGRLRRIVSSWRAERAARRAVLGLPPCTYSSRPISWPGTPSSPDCAPHHLDPVRRLRRHLPSPMPGTRLKHSCAGRWAQRGSSLSRRSGPARH